MDEEDSRIIDTTKVLSKYSGKEIEEIKKYQDYLRKIHEPIFDSVPKDYLAKKYRIIFNCSPAANLTFRLENNYKNDSILFVYKHSKSWPDTSLVEEKKYFITKEEFGLFQKLIIGSYFWSSPLHDLDSEFSCADGCSLILEGIRNNDIDYELKEYNIIKRGCIGPESAYFSLIEFAKKHAKIDWQEINKFVDSLANEFNKKKVYNY